MTRHTDEEAIEHIQHFIEELKLIMLLLGKKNISSLPTAEYTFSS
jgi:isopentenyl diphosphate isomerase/L-lactate dehydrogenase-like FMN-dependent dehydrogenase